MATASHCDTCSTNGLPILLARYAVVPRELGVSLPAWAGGRRVKDVAIGPDYHYALRTLRAGFVYLFYDKNQFGSNQWECYSVTEDGCPIRQPSAEMALAPTARVQCITDGHNALNTRFIVIERPDICGTAWIAFSEHKWSPEALARYTSDSALRDARMQTVKVWPLATTGKHSHGTAATVSAIESVLEYAPGFEVARLPDSGQVALLTEEDGSYSDAGLSQQSTLHPWCLRTGEAGSLVQRMKARAKRSDGGDNVPTVFALWDAVGITHELNGFRNDAVGGISQYGKERKLQITALTAIEGVKKALEDRAADAVDRDIAGHHSMADSMHATRTGALVRQYFRNPDKSGPAIKALDDQRSTGGLEEATYQSRRTALIRQNVPANQQAAAQRDFASIDQDRLHAENARTVLGPGMKADAIARSWPKYRERLDQQVVDAFKRNWSKFLAKADAIIERRTDALLKWLEAPLFLDALEDFHPSSIEDGVLFEAAIADAISGMGSSAAGKKKIDDWVQEAKASARHNLLWRSVALNQSEAIAELDVALALSHSKSNTVLTVESWGEAVVKVKWNKLADIYKKAQSFANTNIRAASSGGTMKEAKWLGFLRIFASAGDRILPGTIGRRVDSVVSEKIFQNLFLLRAGAHVDDVLDLAREQAIRETPDRFAMIRRMQAAEAFANVMEDEKGKLRPNAEVLQQKWAKLAKNADVAGKDGRFNAAKDARLALVVAVLEVFNLAKCGYDANVKKDSKSLVVLGSSIAGLAAAGTDVYANVVKGTLDEASLTFQRLKFFGGVFGGISSILSIRASWSEMENYEREDGVVLYSLAASNLFFSGLGASANALATLTYCGPWLATVAEQQVARRAVIAAAARLAAAAATRLLAFRAILMGVGLGANLLVLGVQIAIWCLKDDELQKWCEQSPFGLKRDHTWDIEKENAKLYEAVFALGLAR